MSISGGILEFFPVFVAVYIMYIWGSSTTIVPHCNAMHWGACMPAILLSLWSIRGYMEVSRMPGVQRGCLAGSVFKGKCRVCLLANIAETLSTEGAKDKVSLPMIPGSLQKLGIPV